MLAEQTMGLPVIWDIMALTLTYWGRVTHICVSDLTITGSDNGLSPGRRQAIIRTNIGILLIRPLGTNFSEIWIEILIFSFKKMPLKVSSAKGRPFCLGLNVLMLHDVIDDQNTIMRYVTAWGNLPLGKGKQITIRAQYFDTVRLRKK